MDKFDEHLSTESLNLKYLPCIRAAVTLDKKTMNKYYSKTDDCDIYRVAMSMLSFYLLSSTNSILTCANSSPLVLHPQYKLRYFKKAKWTLDWIDRAKAITTKIYVRDYASKPLFPGSKIAEKQTDTNSSGMQDKVRR